MQSISIIVAKYNMLSELKVLSIIIEERICDGSQKPGVQKDIESVLAAVKQGGLKALTHNSQLVLYLDVSVHRESDQGLIEEQIGDIG